MVSAIPRGGGLLFFSIIAFSVSCLFAQIPAFPGAEGAGAFATGGRPNDTLGGIVYHVTNLEPDPGGEIPGSLSYGMRNDNFIVVRDSWPLPSHNPQVADSYDVIPRIIVFDVGGTIDLGQTDFDIAPLNFTLAGQTAPGGITLYGAEFNPGHHDTWDAGTPPKTNNIVLRNLSIRTHDPSEKDGLWVPASNSIASHISTSWYTDEGLSITDSARDITVQHSIIGPAWNMPDGDGSQIEGSTPGADISVHHNLYVHNDNRIPRLGEKEGPGVELDFRNNVIYNWGANAAGYSTTSSAGGHEPSFSNFVNNYYIGGADNDGNDVIFSTGNNATRIYQSGNLLDRNFNGSADGVDLGWSAFTGREIQQSAPYSVPHGVTQSAEEALGTVMNYAGANWRDRDFLDQRTIDQLQTFGQGTIFQTGRVLDFIDSDDVDAVVNAPMQTRPVGWDSDNDGMPDHWEIERGLDPYSASEAPDWNGDDDGDGYVNLEEYINEIAAWPAPYDIHWTGGDARYAAINNWSITRENPDEAPTTTHWQPSRFDNAVIDSGTVMMDAPGQHAGAIMLGTNPGDEATLRITAGWLEVEDEVVGPGDGSVLIGADEGAAAVVQLSGGRLIAKSLHKGGGGTLEFTGGVLSAEQVHFDLVNDGGTIAPGNSAGGTHVFGDLTINEGTMEIEIGGTTADHYDGIVVDGHALLGGMLEVNLLEGFQPQAGDNFAFLSTGEGFSGWFEDVQLPTLDAGLQWLLNPGDNTVFLEVQAGFTADFDNDGDVDHDDLATWNVAYGIDAGADADGDGDSDGRDFLLWQQQLGGGAAPARVPEPSTLVGILLTFIGYVSLQGSNLCKQSGVV